MPPLVVDELVTEELLFSVDVVPPAPLAVFVAPPVPPEPLVSDTKLALPLQATRRTPRKGIERYSMVMFPLG